jgi:hypothetical protein
MRPSLYVAFLSLLFLVGCADLSTEEGRLQHDLNILLEEQLHDGEVAAWSDGDTPEIERNLAVFLTCTEEGELCRYYFTFLVQDGQTSQRVFGRSCRNYRRNWEPVHWQPDDDPAMDQLIRSRYDELRDLASAAPNTEFNPQYHLPNTLASQVSKAEKRYELPLRKMIDTTSKQQRLNPVLVHAVVKTESNYNPRARSNAGAVGLMQLMPGTAQELGVNPLQPMENLDGGTRYLRQQLDKPGIRGNVALALAAYNAGYGNVIKHGYSVPPYRETKNYVQKIMSLCSAP